MLILAEAARPEHGWGGMLGIVGAAVACWAIWRVEKWWRKRYGDGDAPSPAETRAPRPLETRRSAASRLPSRDDETPAPSNEGHWAGRIVRDARGVGRRVYDNARHVVATGDSLPANELPEGEEPLPHGNEGPWPFDPDFDGLDDGLDDEAPEIEAYTPPARRETREEYARRCLGEGVDKALVVQGLIENYGMARATAYRVVAAAEARRAA